MFPLPAIYKAKALKKHYYNPGILLIYQGTIPETVYYFEPEVELVNILALLILN
jgi:hypothetical protein